MGKSPQPNKASRRVKPGKVIKDVTAEVENRLLNAAEVATATTSAEVNLAAALADAVIEPGSGDTSGATPRATKPRRPTTAGKRGGKK